MTATSRSPLRDPELVQMLADEPELLALADALVATQPSPARRRRRRRMFAALSGVTAIVALVALFLISPWKSSPTFVERALAAVGGQPVLHVITSQPAPGDALFDVKTGTPISRTLRTEVWFDRSRELKTSVFTIDGRLLDEALETDRGSWTRGGPIYTCAWIAAHPVEATKVGVSCNANGVNGTTPRSVPEAAPELDPALAGFVDRYRAALASGEAHRIGVDTIEGRDVVRLEFAADGRSEQVAVDASSYKPLLIKQGEGAELRVVTAETLPYEPAFFRKPAQITAQSGGSLAAEAAVSPQQAAGVLGGKALWLGRSWNDLRLLETTREERSISYGPGHPPGRATVVDFTYGKVGADGSIERQSEVHIYESTGCVLNVGWTCTARDPSAPGTIQLRGPISILRSDGLFVAIWDLSSDQRRALELARALGPIAPTR